MSGRRIDDHSTGWMGAPEKGGVMPAGAKMKQESSANGAGELGQYWDTTEKIKESQEMGERKIKSNSAKSGQRN